MGVNPNILYDSRARFGSITPSTEESGFAAVNLRDWRTFTKWRPTALPATVDFDPATLAYEFTASADGWTASGATLTPGATALNIASSGTDPQLIGPGSLSINGLRNRYVVARIKRNAGSGWDGSLYYSTKRHASNISYRDVIADPTSGAGGAYVLAIWDMHNPSAGGDDWKKSTITDLRLDLGATASDDFDIDWIIVCDTLSADYALFWSHDLGSQGVTVEIRGSVDNFVADDNLVATVDPEGDEPFALHWTSAQYRYWRIKITAGAASAVPSIGIATIGEKFTIPAYLEIGFDPIGRTPRGVFNKSAGGQPLGRVVMYEDWVATLAFQYVTWTWVRDTWLPAWIAHLRDNPFALSWERTTYQNELHLIEATGGFMTPHRSGSWATLNFEVRGLASE